MGGQSAQAVIMNDLKYLFKLGLDPTSGIQVDTARGARPHKWDAGKGRDRTSGMQAGGWTPLVGYRWGLDTTNGIQVAGPDVLCSRLGTQGSAGLGHMAPGLGHQRIGSTTE